MESLGEQLIEGFDDAGVLSYCLRNACSEIGNSSKEHHELRRAFREFTARCITPRRRE